MFKGQQLAIIGGGKMGSIIAQGLISKKMLSVNKIHVTDIEAARLDYLRSELNLQVSADNKKAARKADIIILAVKPQSMAATLQEISPETDKSKVVISVAAGITTDFIEKLLPAGARVLRVMPNVAALVGEGAAAVARGSAATSADVQLTVNIFKSVGLVIEVDEKLMDAVTGISGSGPAYCLVMIEAMADAGVQMGLSRETALKLSAQTMLGAARLCLQSNQHPAQIKDMVTSPGGTTAAGLKALEEGKIRATLMSAVEAATKRSRELAGGK